MRRSIDIDVDALTDYLRSNYELQAATITRLSIGFDPGAAVFAVATQCGSSWFLKVRAGAADERTLSIPRALIDAGVCNVLAPVRTRSGTLSFPVEASRTMHGTLYPFIVGENAITSGLTDEQWRTFGTTLRAVHDSTIAPGMGDHLKVESFALPSATLVRQITETIITTRFDSPVAWQFAAFWTANADRIDRLLARAESLASSMTFTLSEMVLCHGDIHSGNIIRSPDGGIWLVDWDAPLIAPRERDLLFVVGSRIARAVEPREEDLFFEGYGPVEIDPKRLIYFRYERIIEDLGEFGRGVFLSPHLSESSREFDAQLAISFFAPGGDIDRVEDVSRSRWPRIG